MRIFAEKPLLDDRIGERAFDEIHPLVMGFDPERESWMVVGVAGSCMDVRHLKAATNAIPAKTDQGPCGR